MKECPKCKHSNQEGNAFCVNCGERLENNVPAPSEPVTPVAAPPVDNSQPSSNPATNVQPASSPEPSVQSPTPTEDSNLVPENQVLNSAEKKVTSDKTNKNAIYSLVCSIVAFFIVWPLALAGISLGITSLNQLKTSNEKGRGMAIAGIVIGGLDVLLVLMR